MSLPNHKVDEYIAAFPSDVQQILGRIRETIRKAAPDAEESISYRIPTFKLNGVLIYFDAFKTHIGVYPITPAMKSKFKKEIARYAAGRGTLRFPLDERIPYALIGRIVKVRVRENLDRGKKR